MRGSDIIRKLNADQTHCFVEKEIFDIDPEYDYLIVKGTDEHPRVVCPDHEKAIEIGRYPRLTIEGREVVADIEWTTGHHAFEGDVEPRFSPKRRKSYTIQ